MSIEAATIIAEDQRGRPTPLLLIYYAAFKDSVNILKFLVETIEINPLNPVIIYFREQYIAMYLAFPAASGGSKFLQYLIEIIDNPSSNLAMIRDSNDRTPLHVAAASNNVNAIELLQQLGANLNALDDKGSIPMHDAAISLCPQAINFLKTLGADTRILDNDNMTPYALWEFYYSKYLEISTTAALGLDVSDISN